MATSLYNSFRTRLMQGVFNLDTGEDVIKIALMGEGYIFDPDHSNWTDVDVSGNEIASGGGYALGGATIDTAVEGADEIRFKATTDVTWNAATLTAHGAIIYDATVTGGALIAWIDFGGATQVDNGNLTISWSQKNNVIVSLI